MKIKPIKESNICDEVRYNQNTCGTHIYISSGTENRDKKDYANLTLFSMMCESGFIVKEDGKTNQEMIEEAALRSSDIINETSVRL